MVNYMLNYGPEPKSINNLFDMSCKNNLNAFDQFAAASLRLLLWKYFLRRNSILRPSFLIANSLRFVGLYILNQVAFIDPKRALH